MGECVYPYDQLSYIYINKVYPLVGDICVYIYVWIVPGRSVHIYHSAWTRLCVAYLHLEAMLRPERRDRRGMKLVSTYSMLKSKHFL